jgi:predicted nucleic acid-binding protein
MPEANPDRFFLDSNVLIYLFDGRVPVKRERSRILIREALAGGGLISYQVVQECMNVLHRAKQVSAQEIRHFLDTALMPLCEIYPTGDLFDSALGISGETGWTYYDSLIVAAASKAGCAQLYTEDLQDGRVFRGVKIQNPFK